MLRSAWPAGRGGVLRRASSSLLVFGTLAGGRKADESEVPQAPSGASERGCTLARVGEGPQAPPSPLCPDPSLHLYSVCSGTTARQMRNTDETGNKSLGDKSIYIAGVILNFI